MAWVADAMQFTHKRRCGAVCSAVADFCSFELALAESSGRQEPPVVEGQMRAEMFTSGRFHERT